MTNPKPGKLQLPPGMTSPLHPTAKAKELSAGMGGACHAALNVMINKAHLCFIVPPPADRPFSSWRAIIYTKEPPQKVFHSNRTYPTELKPDKEIMKRELCDPDHVVAFVVQVTDKDQYIYIEEEVCEVLGVEVHLADATKDPYLEKKGKSPKPSSSLVLPGQAQPSGGGGRLLSNSGMATGNEDMTDVHIVDITFKTHAVKDQDVIDRVKEVVWKANPF